MEEVFGRYIKPVVAAYLEEGWWKGAARLVQEAARPDGEGAGAGGGVGWRPGRGGFILDSFVETVDSVKTVNYYRLLSNCHHYGGGSLPLLSDCRLYQSRRLKQIEVARKVNKIRKVYLYIYSTVVSIVNRF